MRTPTDLELSYLAGLIDGEGNISLSRSGADRAYRYPVVGITSTDKELLALPLELFGGSVSSKKPRKTNHKTAYEYRLDSNRALAFLRLVCPYLRHPEKIRRTEILLSGYDWFTKRNGKYTPRERKLKLLFEECFLNAINGKNSRGVKITQNNS